MEQNSAPIPEAESLEDETPQEEATLDEIEKSKRRITHIENDFDALEIIRDVRFERVMFFLGIGLVVVVSLIVFFFYNTVEVREYRMSLAAQVEADFYANLLKDKNYVFSYRIDDGLKQFDPLAGETVELLESESLGKLSSASASGYRIENGANARIIDRNGKTILELADRAIHINNILLAPDENSLIFDTRPADRQAEEKFGLRLGAFEYKLGEEDFDILVSDASPGIADLDYLKSFVNILSFSPNGRYLAYTNQKTLWLLDRLSNASVRIAELSRADQKPGTGWAERIEPEETPSTGEAETTN